MPKSRIGHTTSYYNHKLYIFGGRNKNTYLSDLLIFDLVKGNIPDGRAGHASSVCGKNIFYFGGRNGSLLLQDCFLFSTEKNNWKRLAPIGSIPPARAGHTVNSIDDKKVLLWGGSDWENYWSNLYMYDLETNIWKEIEIKGTIPEPRFWHSSCIGYKMLIFGGENNKSQFKDFYALDFYPLTVKINEKSVIDEKEEEIEDVIEFPFNIQ